DAHVIEAALEKASTPKHAQVIAEKLVKMPPLLQLAAAEALGRLKAKAQATALFPFLDGDVPHRSAALRALAEMANPAVANAVVATLSDAHPSVRRQAIRTTAKLIDAPTREARAIAMLDDPDPTVRQAAAEVLTPAPSRAALTALIKQLNIDYSPL